MKTQTSVRVPEVPDVVIVYDAPGDISSDDWRDFLVLLSAQPPVKAILVLTKGGAPDPVQRDEIMKLFQNIPLPRIGVYTDSIAVRGVITLLRWFWKNEISAIGMADKAGMQKHLRLTNEEFAHATACLDRVCRAYEPAAAAK